MDEENASISLWRVAALVRMRCVSSTSSICWTHSSNTPITLPACVSRSVLRRSWSALSVWNCTNNRRDVASPRKYLQKLEKKISYRRMWTQSFVCPHVSQGLCSGAAGPHSVCETVQITTVMWRHHENTCNANENRNKISYRRMWTQSFVCLQMCVSRSVSCPCSLCETVQIIMRCAISEISAISTKMDRPKTSTLSLINKAGTALLRRGNDLYCEQWVSL